MFFFQKKYALKKISFCMLLVNSSALVAKDFSEVAFRSAFFKPPANYQGPVFKLRHHYPKSIATPCNKAQCPWIYLPVAFTFKEQTLSPAWQEYEHLVKKTLQDNFYIQQNQLKVSKHWYSMPWLATNPDNAQEFIHGAKYSFIFTPQESFHHKIRDLLLKKKENKTEYELWGIAYYNHIAAYTLGQIWGADGNLHWKQQGTKKMLAGLPFADGSIKVKFNFLSTAHLYPEHAEAEPVMMLHRHQEKYDAKSGHIIYDMKHRAILPSTLAEIQVGVVDHRSPTGYIYFSYAFNPLKKHQLNGNLIDNFDLIGIQIGNDPYSFPAVELTKSQAIHETYFSEEGRKIKLGCAGRLMTYVGTTKQSCTGCHQTAYIDQTSKRPLGLEYPGTCDKDKPANLKYSYYFQNLRYPQSYDKPNLPKDLISLDESLRLQDAILAYEAYKKANLHTP